MTALACFGLSFLQAPDRLRRDAVRPAPACRAFSFWNNPKSQNPPQALSLGELFL